MRGTLRERVLKGAVGIPFVFILYVDNIFCFR